MGPSTAKSPPTGRVMDVLAALADSPNGRTSAELAKSCGISTSTCALVLAELERRAWVARREDRRYVLGSGLFGLVHGLRAQFPLLDRGRDALRLPARHARRGLLDVEDRRPAPDHRRRGRPRHRRRARRRPALPHRSAVRPGRDGLARRRFRPGLAAPGDAAADPGGNRAASAGTRRHPRPRLRRVAVRRHPPVAAQPAGRSAGVAGADGAGHPPTHHPDDDGDAAVGHRHPRNRAWPQRNSWSCRFSGRTASRSTKSRSTWAARPG